MSVSNAVCCQYSMIKKARRGSGIGQLVNGKLGDAYAGARRTVKPEYAAHFYKKNGDKRILVNPKYSMLIRQEQGGKHGPGTRHEARPVGDRQRTAG
jgi:hypothetical protein